MKPKARLVFYRDGDFKGLLSIEDTLKIHQIELLPLNEDVISRSNELMQEYHFLRIFDAIHVATAQLNGLEIMSTDHSFPKIKGLEVEDPRF